MKYIELMRTLLFKKRVQFYYFFNIYPMKYFIQTVYHTKDTYLISTLCNFYKIFLKIQLLGPYLL